MQSHSNPVSFLVPSTSGTWCTDTIISQKKVQQSKRGPGSPASHEQEWTLLTPPSNGHTWTKHKKALHNAPGEDLLLQPCWRVLSFSRINFFKSLLGSHASWCKAPIYSKHVCSLHCNSCQQRICSSWPATAKEWNVRLVPRIFCGPSWRKPTEKQARPIILENVSRLETLFLRYSIIFPHSELSSSYSETTGSLNNCKDSFLSNKGISGILNIRKHPTHPSSLEDANKVRKEAWPMELEDTFPERGLIDYHRGKQSREKDRALQTCKVYRKTISQLKKARAPVEQSALSWNEPPRQIRKRKHRKNRYFSWEESTPQGKQRHLENKQS